MASAKCSRATTGFSTSYGRGKYWLIYQKPGGQEKGRPFTTVGLKCCTAIPENANICASHTYRVALLNVIPSEQRSRKCRRLNFMPIAFGRRSSFFCSAGMKLAFYASATSVLKVALYDNQKRSLPLNSGIGH